jgi:uncharacterized protein
MQPWIDRIVLVLAGTWAVTAEMAPYLIFGFLMAGILSAVVTRSYVERHLGGRGWRPPLKAALVGVPLPLCSCGVIPVAASLRRHGASRGAVAAFLMSTPQTGVDSIAVTYGLLGPVFAVFRPLAAFLSGALCGIAVDRLAPEAPAQAAAAPAAGAPPGGVLRRMLRHAFVTLPGDIHRPMLLGLLVAGVLGALVPADFFADRIGRGFGSMLVMVLIGIPMYVCSTASVPIALGLIQTGITPGAALVFLITGPATNAATVAAMVRMLGLRTAIVYLVCLVGTALGSGLLMDRWLTPSFGAHLCPHLPAGALSWPGHAAALVLVAMLVAPFFRRKAAPSVPSAPAACACRCGRKS